MATDTPPTSNKKAPSLMEWDSLSEEDQIKLQEEFINFLNSPGALQIFSQDCRGIGQAAVAVSEDFMTVKNGFTGFVERYGNDFPDVQHFYALRWDGLMARWNGEAGILWSSRKLAADTVASLTDYSRVLGLVMDIGTQDDLKDAQIQLAEYVGGHPIDISEKVADEFGSLRSDIQNFSADFAKYLMEEMQMLSADAKKYEAEIKHLQTEITELNKKIAAPVIALGGSFALAIVESLIPLAALTSVIIERTTARQKLDVAKANLNTVSEESELAAMQAQFESLKPYILEICFRLCTFAEIWAFTTVQASAINAGLQEGMEALKRQKFRVLLRLVMAQIQPLTEGLRQYANQIVPP